MYIQPIIGKYRQLDQAERSFRVSFRKLSVYVRIIKTFLPPGMIGRVSTNFELSSCRVP